MNRKLIPALLGLLLVGATACGGAGASDDETGKIADPTGTCEVGSTGCSDDPSPEGFDLDEARQRAHGVLGMFEDDLPDDVRISQRGDEEFMLTQEYEVGRLTAVLDDTDGSGFRVIKVTVELPDGPETYDLQPS